MKDGHTGLARARRWARAGGGAAVLGCTVLGCATTPPASAPTGTRADGPAVVTDDSGAETGRTFRRPGELEVETARAEARRILKEVAAARNLEVQTEVKVNVVDKDGIRKFARANMYEHTTKEEMALHGRIESSLGGLPVGANVERVLLDMLEDGVLGFYDPKRETLFIGDFVSTSMLSQVVGHEIAHGLQDMHFDLENHMLPIPHRGDAEQARRFLIEGGAQAAYFAWVSGEDGLGSIDDAVLDAMSNQTLEYAGAVSDFPILVRGLQMPYTDGTATVIRLVLAKGWSAVDALYADMPQTTEQMLHLDKLLANEGAFEMSFAAPDLAAATGMSPVWHDELGEATLLAMLAEVEPSLIARRAAAGWAGDTLLALAPAGKATALPTVIAAVAWDSADDATEFEVSFRKYLDENAAGGTFVERKRDLVVFGTNIPTSVDTPALIDATLAALQRSKGPTAKRRSRK